MYRALVTGFENFKGYENPTKIIIDEFRNRTIEGIELVPEILPVSFEGSVRRIFELIEFYRPSIILSLGQGYPDADKLRIEKRGKNIADGRDESGVIMNLQVISPNGPDSIEVNLPIEQLCNVMNERGIPSYVSQDAKEYVCNYLIYSVMQELGPDRKFGFYHIPDPRESSLRLEQLVQSVDITLISQKPTQTN